MGQAKIQKVKELASDLDRRKAACEDRLRRLDAERNEVEGLLERAEGALRNLSSFATKPALASTWARGEGSFAARLSSAEERLGQARLQIDRGFERQDLDGLSAARNLVESTLADLRNAINDARRELGELSVAAASALQQLEESEAGAHRFLRSLSDLEPHPPGSRGGSRRSSAPSEPSCSAGTRPRSASSKRSRPSSRRISAASNTPPAARRASFTKRSRRSSEAISRRCSSCSPSRPTASGGPRPTSARYALHRATPCGCWGAGEEDPELSDQVRREAFECHQIGDLPELGPAYFSPRFLDFFAAAATPAPEPEAAEGEVAAGEIAEDEAAGEGGENPEVAVEDEGPP